ncbi:MAG TPA: TadE/TadG family type IV pilus assembly protein [Micromonospora sp.]
MVSTGRTGGRFSTGRAGAERGSVAVEVAILTPAFLALVAVAIVVGRLIVAQNAIDGAAHDAARAASISRDADSARAAARTAVQQRLDWSNLHCASRPELTFSGRIGDRAAGWDTVFDSRPGTEAYVTVEVTCVVSYADLIGAGAPGSDTVQARFTSPLDRFRSRALGPGALAPGGSTGPGPVAPYSTSTTTGGV